VQGTIRAIPTRISVHNGHHLLTPETRVCAAPELVDVVRKALERADLPLSEVGTPGDGVITFTIGGDRSMARLGYTLKITETTVHAASSSEDGLLRAAETLRLLMHAQTGTFGRFHGWQLPCVEIIDYGR
jgi:Glycosyl hydrolase family 20, domain 2